MNIQELYKELIELPALAPTDRVNALFTELVKKAVDSQSSYALDMAAVGKLQKICGEAECELEKYWARRIIDSKEPRVALEEFPYIKNYRELTKLEWHCVHGCAEQHDHRVLFVGSGAMPLTAIILAIEHGISSTVIDIDHEAVSLSQQVISMLGLADSITVICENAGTFSRYGDFTVIFLAALAGMSTKEKLDIFKQIKKLTTSATHLLARSSWGNRKLLYRPLPKSVYRFFTPVIEVHPHNDIVNSIIILQNIT